MLSSTRFATPSWPSVEHGCIGETLSAVECAIALEQTEDPEVRAVLEQIVEDEARHAALAWPAGIGVLGGSDAREARQWALDTVVEPALAVHRRRLALERSGCASSSAKPTCRSGGSLRLG